MSRAHFRDTLLTQTSPPRLLTGATVMVREVGTTTPIAQTMYTTRAGATTLANPITTGASGTVELWVPERGTYDLYITHPDYAAATITVEVDGDPAEDVTETGTQTIGGTKTHTAPLLTTPSIVGGTIDGATVSNATIVSPGLQNPQVTSGALLVQTGTASVTSMAKAGDADTGVFLHATNDRMGLAAGGIEVQVDKASNNAGAAFIWSRRMDSGASAAKSMLTMHLGDSGSPVNSNNAANIAARSYLTMSSPENPAALLGEVYVQGGTGGFGVGAVGLARVDPGWSGSGESGVIGVIGSGVANRDSVTVWGSNFFATTPDSITAPATALPNSVTLCGIEVDVGGKAGSTVSSRYGVQVVANATQSVSVSGEDQAYRLINKVGGAKWKNAFVVGGTDAGGTWPLTSTGTILYAGAGSTGKGIDLASVTFADNSLAVPGLKVTNNNPGTPSTAIGNGVDFTPQSIFHARHSSSTNSVITTVEGDMNTRLAGQVTIRGRTSTDKRLYLGFNTTDNYGLIQAHNNAGGTYPLILQPIGGVTVVGDPTTETPDTAVALHVIGATNGSAGTVALRLHGKSTTTAPGSNGAAGAPTANPVKWYHIKDASGEYKFPVYNI